MISCIWLWTFWLWIDYDTQPMRALHWYSNTQTNGGYSLVFWYPNQWGLFIGTLIRSYSLVLWYPAMGVIHWYSNTQSQGYSVTIVIRLLRIWITFEHLNYFESFKIAYVFLEPIVSYSFWYLKNWLLSKPSMIYL